MKDFALDRITVDHGYAIVGIAGQNMDEGVVASDAVVALRDAGIESVFINAGSSDTTVLIGVKESSADDAVRAIYNKLFA